MTYKEARVEEVGRGGLLVGEDQGDERLRSRTGLGSNQSR